MLPAETLIEKSFFTAEIAEKAMVFVEVFSAASALFCG